MGRSPFYTHDRGKDDLLLRSFTGMLEGLDQSLPARAAGAPARIAPVRELLHHIAGFRAFHQALRRSRMLDRTLQAGAEQLSQSIAARIAALPRPPGAGRVPPHIAAPVLAGAVFGLLRWWIEQERPPTPETMDEMYHALFLGPT